MLLYIAIGVSAAIITVVVIVLLIIHFMRCKEKDMRELKLRIQLAIRTLKANINKVQDDFMDTNPFILLSTHPFYKDVLQLPFYVDRNRCFTREAIHAVVKDTYGTNPEYSTPLHTRLGDDPYHYLIIDINTAFDYYDRYKNAGLPGLLL
jgi:hypothetical protein